MTLGILGRRAGGLAGASCRALAAGSVSCEWIETGGSVKVSRTTNSDNLFITYSLNPQWQTNG
jgi:hypothetical protein